MVDGSRPTASVLVMQALPTLPWQAARLACASWRVHRCTLPAQPCTWHGPRCTWFCSLCAASCGCCGGPGALPPVRTACSALPAGCEYPPPGSGRCSLGRCLQLPNHLLSTPTPCPEAFARSGPAHPGAQPSGAAQLRLRRQPRWHQSWRPPTRQQLQVLRWVAALASLLSVGTAKPPLAGRLLTAAQRLR